MANEVSLSLDTGAAEAKLERLVKLIREAEAAMGRLSGGSAASPAPGGYSTGAGSGGGVGGSATPNPPSQTTPASAAAAASVARLSAPQQAIANQLYGAGLSAPELRAAWAQVGLPGTPGLSPSAATLQMSASPGTVALDPTLRMFAPWGAPSGPGMQTGAYSPGMGPGNLYQPAPGFQFPFTSFGKTVSAGMLLAGAGAMSAVAQQTISGHVDPMAWAQTAGAIPGMIAGAAIGGVPGAAIGAAITASMSQMLLAPLVKGYEVSSGAIPGVGLTATGANFISMMKGEHDWARGAALDINTRLLRSGIPPTQFMSDQFFAEAASNVKRGLYGSGIDPMEAGPTFAWPGTPGTAGTRGRYRFGDTPPPGPFAGQDAAARTIDVLADTARRAVIAAAGGYRTPGIPGTPGTPAGSEEEALYHRIARRVAIMYPDEGAAKGVISEIMPIWRSRPYTGNNVADIIARYGTAAYYDYDRTTNPGRTARIPIEQANEFEASLQRTQRGIEMGGLQTRGSGAAIAGGYSERMRAIAGLPGGTDSLEYAKAFAGHREGVALQFEQETMEGYGVGRSNLQALRGISAASPFAPGNRFAISLGIMAANRIQMRRLNEYYAGRAARGELSEAEQLRLTEQFNALRVENAQELGLLSEGVENRLPALFAGRPGGFRRFDSMQMAALNAPFYVRAYGAMGGRQARVQEDFVRGFDTGPIGPRSPMANLNTVGGGRTESLLQQVVSILEQIKNQGGGGNRGSAPPPMGGYSPGGNSTPFN